MKLTGEVRHLTGIKTNFAVRNKEYIGIATLKEEALRVEYRQRKKEDNKKQQEQ